MLKGVLGKVRLKSGMFTVMKLELALDPAKFASPLKVICMNSLLRGVVVTVAVRVWLPLASVPGVGVTGPGIEVYEPKKLKFPVIGGVFPVVVTVAVTVML